MAEAGNESWGSMIAGAAWTTVKVAGVAATVFYLPEILDQLGDGAQALAGTNATNGIAFDSANNLHWAAQGLSNAYVDAANYIGGIGNDVEKILDTSGIKEIKTDALKITAAAGDGTLAKDAAAFTTGAGREAVFWQTVDGIKESASKLADFAGDNKFITGTALAGAGWIGSKVGQRGKAAEVKDSYREGYRDGKRTAIGPQTAMLMRRAELSERVRAAQANGRA